MKKFKVESEMMLREFGFEYDEECNVWRRNDWSICISKKEVKKLKNMYDEGCRICWMNRERYVNGLEFVLSDDCSCGIWFCGSVEECLSIIEEENW